MFKQANSHDSSPAFKKYNVFVLMVPGLRHPTLVQNLACTFYRSWRYSKCRTPFSLLVLKHLQFVHWVLTTWFCSVCFHWSFCAQAIFFRCCSDGLWQQCWASQLLRDRRRLKKQGHARTAKARYRPAAPSHTRPHPTAPTRWGRARSG